MARRTNYGFEKRQRELRKQQKKREKAERRAEEDVATGSAPESGSAEDEAPPESGSSDRE